MHRRMLLPSSDPSVLAAMSVGFGYDPATARDYGDGVRVIPTAELREVSVCRRADARQRTVVSSVKSRATTAEQHYAEILKEHGLEYLAGYRRLWREVAVDLATAGVSSSDPDFTTRVRALERAKVRPATRTKSAPPKRTERGEPYWDRVVTSTMEGQAARLAEDVLAGRRVVLEEDPHQQLARKLYRIAADAGHPYLGERLRDPALIWDRDTDLETMKLSVSERIANYVRDNAGSATGICTGPRRSWTTSRGHAREAHGASGEQRLHQLLRRGCGVRRRP